MEPSALPAFCAPKQVSSPPSFAASLSDTTAQAPWVTSIAAASSGNVLRNLMFIMLHVLVRGPVLRRKPTP
ncbi:hypothetical protein D3C80_2039610 [compost metagenome]